jgi:hypothetical protein
MIPCFRVGMMTDGVEMFECPNQVDFTANETDLLPGWWGRGGLLP